MTHDSGQWRNETVPDVDLGSTLRATVGGLRRQWRLIAGLVLALLVLVLIYLQMAVPQYTARAALIVDPRISNSVNGPEAPTLLLSDALVVDSEIEVLSSRVVTSRVAENLGLFDAPDEEDAPGPLARLRAIFASDETPILQGEDAEAARRETIRQKMMRGFEIRRAGGTYAIQIAFTDEDPVLASRAVNALIDEYFVAASDASLSDTRRISGWLEQRVAVLADEVKDADHAVASYRRENNLFVMRDDRLPSEAELSAANDRMIALRSRLIDLQTTEERITLILSSDSVAPLLDGTLGGEVASPALRDMQTRFSRLLAEGAELTGRWGEDSDIVARNRLDQSQLRDLMLDEVGQIAERVRSQIGAVRQQIIATESQIGELRDKASADAEKSIRLQELEREVEAKRSQYETMLGQMVLATQNETFQRAPARIIARAVPPDEKSKPAGKRLLVLSVFSGLVLGAGIAFLREVTDNRLRLVSDLRQGLGLRWLGVLPRQGTDPAPHLRDLTAELQRRRPEDGALVCGIAAARHDHQAGALAGPLAQMLAAQDRVAVLSLGANVPGLPAPQPVRLSGQGLGDDVAGQPTVISAAAADGVPVLSRRNAAALADFMQALRRDFDHVILLLPPLENHVETELAAPLVDCAVLVVPWGQVTLPDLAQPLQEADAIRPRLLGAVFAVPSMREFRRHNP